MNRFRTRWRAPSLRRERSKRRAGWPSSTRRAHGRPSTDTRTTRVSRPSLAWWLTGTTDGDHDSKQAALDAIWEKVEAGERLDADDGLTLMESDDVLQLGELADTARRRRGGTDDVYFVQNLYLNQANVCRVRRCKFCAFARTERSRKACTYTPDEPSPMLSSNDGSRVSPRSIWSAARVRTSASTTTEDIVARLHEAMPDVHLKLFTASEIHRMTAFSGSTHEVLRRLRDAGLGSLPGGGAEIFADRVRRLVAPGKEHPDIWFETHRTAHGLGIPTHCTMLYGHVETYEERIDHLLRLRDLQDETGGFLAFIPLAFHPENTVFERRGWTHRRHGRPASIAVSRLMLDNVAHVKNTGS